jgi:CTP synthase
VEEHSREKISLFCNVDVDNVLSVPDVSNIFQVPLLLLEQDFHTLLADRLGLRLTLDKLVT